MPTARESLLDAAHAAIEVRPWAVIRMVDVAATAGVSRQTLYNEFGSKHGLGSALVARAVDAFLADTERALAEAVEDGVTDPAEALLDAASWILGVVDDSPLLRAVLTGCWSESLPEPTAKPAEVLYALRRRAVRVLERAGVELATAQSVCEAVLRLTLSYVVAPGTDAESTRRGLLNIGRTAQRWSVPLPPLTGGQQPAQ